MVQPDRVKRHCQALVGGLAASLMLGGAVGAGVASAATTTTIRVWSAQTSSRLVHNAPPKTVGSRGDVIAVGDRLTNATSQFGKPANATIGADRATFTFLSKSEIKFAGSATLPSGTLEFAGTASLTSIAIQIVGGTGKYLGARGTMTEPNAKSDTKSKALNIYRFTVPTTGLAA
jgi:hypothetical protein